MRAAALLVAALLAASTAGAEPSTGLQSSPAPYRDTASNAPLAGLSSPVRFAAARRNDLPLLGPQPQMPAAASSGFSIGPLHADTVTRYSARSGKAHFAPHYQLDGVTVLGGAIGGSLDGRGGMLTLQWRSAP